MNDLTRALLLPAAFLLGSCRGPWEPQLPKDGPTFAGTVSASGHLVAGAVVDGDAAQCCLCNDVVSWDAAEEARTDAAGTYELTLLMEKGTKACVKLTAWLNGERVAWLWIEGFRYQKEGQRYTAHLTSEGGVVTFQPPMK